MIKLNSLISSFLISTSILFTNTGFAEEIIVPVTSGDEITIEQFPAEGKYLMLWLSPEYGLRDGHRSLAKILSDQKIEVWLGNILESLFIPLSSSALKKLNGSHVADIIEYAHKMTNKKIIVVGDSYAALNALTGANQWQQKQINDNYFIGAVLFTPNTFATIPPLGQLPEYMPIISATNIPIMIYQAKNNGNIGQFDSLVEKLQQHGNPVYTRLVPKAMSLFYNNEAAKKMLPQVKALAKNIKNMITLLEKHTVPVKPIAYKKSEKIKSGLDIVLKKYKGKIKPLPIKLKNAYGKTIVKNSYKGQVTIINFWATWCPPCVQEIPSLNRLKQKMAGLSFELISINYAEDKKTILDFMKKVKVDFPVLLDRDGSFAKKWNVITYPSTFVINKEGKIIYGVNAAIEWDNPEFIKKLKSLL